MPKRFLAGSGGIIFHVMNRGARRGRLFESSDDYAAFLAVLCETQERFGTRLLSFAAMPNHWHLVVWPARDGDLSRDMQWLTRTHAQRWHLARRSVGTGAVYQGRYRAIPVQHDVHFLTVCRYVERNALRAGLVDNAEDWRWGSAWNHGEPSRPVITNWPVAPPEGWLECLNASDPSDQLAQLRESIRKQVPFGDETWRSVTATRLRMTPGLRGRGRPPMELR